DKLNAAKVREEIKDPLTYDVIQEAVPGVQGQGELRRVLSHDTYLLRLIDAGQEDRLIWVNDELEVLESDPTPTDPYDTSNDGEEADITPDFQEFGRDVIIDDGVGEATA